MITQIYILYSLWLTCEHKKQVNYESKAAMWFNVDYMNIVMNLNIVYMYQQSVDNLPMGKS